MSAARAARKRQIYRCLYTTVRHGRHAQRRPHAYIMYTEAGLRPPVTIPRQDVHGAGVGMSEPPGAALSCRPEEKHYAVALKQLLIPR